MTELTNTQKTILEAAATRSDGDINPLPDRIKGGAALKVVTALEKKGLIFDAGLKPPYKDWHISDDGYRAIGQEPPKPETQDEPEVEAKPVRKTRTGTKQARIIEMLKRPQGASIEQIAEITGWRNHTVRGFFAGTLKKKLGLELTRSRTESTGPGQTGSITIYRLAG